MWNFDKPWHQDPVISPRLRFHMFWPSWGAGSCQTHDSRFLFEVFGTFLADWFRMCFFFPFIHLKIYDHQKWIKRSDWGSISQLHCFNFKQGSFQAFFKCEMSCVSCVFCQHVCWFLLFFLLDLLDPPQNTSMGTHEFFIKQDLCRPCW